MWELILVMGGVWVASKLFEQSGGSITLPSLIHPSATPQATLPKITSSPVPLSSGTNLVSDIQKMLNALGYTPKLVVDGIYGDKTKKGIQAFQKAQGLPIDGVATVTMKAALNETMGPINWEN